MRYECVSACQSYLTINGSSQTQALMSPNQTNEGKVVMYVVLVYSKLYQTNGIFL